MRISAPCCGNSMSFSATGSMAIAWTRKSSAGGRFPRRRMPIFPAERRFDGGECGFCRQNANPTASNGRSGGKMAIRRGRISIFPGKWRFDGRRKPVLSGKWRFDACGSDVFSAERPFPPGGRAVFSTERGFRAEREAVFWPGGRFPPGRRRSLRNSDCFIRTSPGQVIAVLTAGRFERQRRGTCQPRATP